MREDLSLKVLIAVVSLGLVGVFWRTPRPELGTPRAPASDIQAEYRRRRRRSLRYGIVWVASFVGMILSYFLFTRPLPGFLGSTFVAVAFSLVALAAFAISHLYLWSTYRCPACEGHLADGDGFILNPDSCPHCGVSLR